MERKMNIKTSLINSSLANKPLEPTKILQMIADPDLLGIWKAIRDGSITTKEIMLKTMIPQTTLYRKLSWLLDNGIVKGVVKHENYCYIVKFYPVIEDFSGNLNSQGQKLSIKLWGKEKRLELVTMQRIKQS